ncbi:MAG: hypothetical protein ABR564_05425 [Candidatus Dormibacteria bacterium]
MLAPTAAALAGLAAVLPVWAAVGTISTAAGNGAQGYSGDGGAATAAMLNRPQSPAVDGSLVFFADEGNQRVRVFNMGSTAVTQDGVSVGAGQITTVAGNGTQGYGGDGSAATSALLNNPQAVTVDGSHNLYIADTTGQRIRRVDSAGVITTVAGNGTACSSATSACGDNGLPTTAQLNSPYGVAVSGTTLYVADFFNRRVRKVDLSAGGLITAVTSTVSSSGGYSGDGGPASAAELHSPIGVTVDGGVLYITEQYNHDIRKVDTSGNISTVAGCSSACNGTQHGFGGDGGQATGALLFNPFATAVDSAHNLYISDESNYRVRKVDSAGVISTVAGSGRCVTTVTPGLVPSLPVVGTLPLPPPLGPSTTSCSQYGGDGGQATSALLNTPRGVAVDGTTLYIADTNNDRVRTVQL